MAGSDWQFNEQTGNAPVIEHGDVATGGSSMSGAGQALVVLRHHVVVVGVAQADGRHGQRLAAMSCSHRGTGGHFTEFWRETDRLMSLPMCGLAGDQSCNARTLPWRAR